VAGYFVTVKEGGVHRKSLYDHNTHQLYPETVKAVERVGCIPWHDCRRPWDEPIMAAFTEGREFYATLKGYELKQLPDVPIVCKPLLNTSTHQLALETSPQWVMKIRHVGSWRIKTRPKVRIYREDMSGWRAAPAICFDLPSCHRFETVESAFRHLAACDFQLSQHNINLRAIQRTEENKIREQLRAEVRREIEDKVRAEMKEEVLNSFPSLTDMLVADTAETRRWLAARRPKASRKAAVLSSAEVIDLRERLRARGLFLPEVATSDMEEPSDLSATG
jgi:hypothetical protein